MINLVAKNRQSFGETTRALEWIDRYFVTRGQQEIEEADRHIDEAIRADSNYALAVFYRGFIHDLRGTPVDALPYFARILNECTDPHLTTRARFNQGVAYYHLYSRRSLAEAIRCFEGVLDESEDESIQSLCLAHLIQVHAMWMRPPADEKQSNAVDRKEIERHFAECKANLERLAARKGQTDQVAATARNGWGMANMYLTDYVATGREQKRGHLEVAEEALTRADKLLPKDWANTCDLGSLSLRQGAFKRDVLGEDPSPHLQNAVELLQSVTRVLRPGYGFALHEIGIVFRVWGQWEDAKRHQLLAKQVPDRYRDVSVNTVDDELKRIEKRDSSYP